MGHENTLFAFLGGLALSILLTTPGACADYRSRDALTALVVQVQRADYEGDRIALKRLHEELATVAPPEELADEVWYWRGFALWRRALNGFNESADPRELEQDLTMAVDAFTNATVRNPAFVDAKVGAASCLQNLSFLHYLQKDMTHSRELMQASLLLLADAQAREPENPRLLWVLGAYRWHNPSVAGGGHDAAIETYGRGLASSRRARAPARDALQPSWGEPELLANLAFAHLHRATPDPLAAERHACSALKFVPYWHYVRDILLAQIRAAIDKMPDAADHPSPHACYENVR